MEQIASVIKGIFLQKISNVPGPAWLSLDSRKVLFPESTVFFSLKTRHQNANIFIETLYKKGVRNFVTDDKSIDITALPAANIIIVSSTISALQKIATSYRNEFRNLPVIGITGSNGKTIVKEWLNHLLENEYSIARSPKSYNSQIGVPLSVLNIKKGNDLALLEAGISLPGEMEKLEKIIQPDIGILTNIGNAHDEGFKSRDQKLREKLILFKKANRVIFNSDNKEIFKEIKLLQQENKKIQLFSWGKKQGNTLQIKSVVKTNFIATIEAVYKKETFKISIPFIDNASVENAVNCWCVLFVLNKTSQEVFNRFNSLYSIEMRLELKRGINRCTIINDSYSNDLQSLSIALDFLNQQKQHNYRTLILSDFLQSGITPKDLYTQVSQLLKQYQIDRLFGIGPDISSYQNEFSFLKKKLFFENTDHFLKNIQLHQFRDENILIKGARQFQFEKVSHSLEQKVHQTVLSINLNALVFNFKKYKEMLHPSTKIMAMVKASGYGSGSHEIASVLEYNKVDYLAVAYADEGIELRQAGIELPIMVMNIDNSTFDSIVNNNLEPEIFSFELLHDFISYLKLNDLENYPVHLKIDSGMHRLGFEEKNIDQLSETITKNKYIKIKSVFTHLVASDDENEDDFTFQQFNIFKSCCLKIEKVLGYSFYKHISNTSAISRLPQLQMDMVRLGIGLYGFDGNKKMQKKLKNVVSLTTTISQIKNIKAGETVGYGRNAIVKKDSVIATVRIGYADGYSRILGNGNGKMRIKNKLVPVIGNVCMDMTMLDITGIKKIKEGDQVTVFGESPSIEELAEWSNTIPYEIMTGISQRVKRVYFEE
jgi:alanine racemase